ncbi:guanine deaminase [Eubacterium sp. am_0171]|uniref:Guanine deaminase n=1 Tax=Faecalicatena contorta TaxID=39482 RepID=A0A174D782_9FIRM|nr:MULTISPECIES: amidohydrolase family protein [Clostridia]MSC84772.1 amidohydrolase family protein [Eubacterium sp. BIOML-A1]MSD08267.1 amidohydrolase family protein [Eubacterium sp. BIOML-A2]RYT11422.1 guanine deaminase [Eubacterium sp. am_0171]CUO21582.1 Guanine deaminase [[Eubacterium] contortum] [Faecalicatena contorta]
MNESIFILKGNIVYSRSAEELEICEHGYLVCENGRVKGVYQTLPFVYGGIPITDYEDRLIIPGLVDLHVHAPQYSYRGLGMDMELLEWLETNTFPEEAKFRETEYAKKAYRIFVDRMRRSATTRACIFATVHREATLLLMDMLEEAGLSTMVGKVNMDRNCPDYLREESAEVSAAETVEWIKDVLHKKYKHTRPILTPRFTPSCTDDLMERLKMIQMRYELPLQSHLSENPGEISWVKELCPWSEFYGDAYDKFGLFGSDCPTIMAHCVYSDEKEITRMKENGVYIAHCPESNMNIASGVAPVRRFLAEGLHVGMGSDVAGGSTESIFTAMAHAIQSSKLRWRLLDDSLKPLTVEEAFYMATKGGGEFFGRVGSFEEGYEMDAVVLDDTRLEHPQPLDVKKRLERMIYFSDDREIYAKYVEGSRLF